MMKSHSIRFYDIPVCIRKFIIVSYLPISQWDELRHCLLSSNENSRSDFVNVANSRLENLTLNLNHLLREFLEIDNEPNPANIGLEKTYPEEEPIAGAVTTVSLSNVVHYGTSWQHEFHRELNLLIGDERKTTIILKAIAACLSPHTESNTCFLSELVHPGAPYATIKVGLSNSGRECFRTAIYGNEITIHCRIFPNGSRYRWIKNRRYISWRSYDQQIIRDKSTLEVERVLKFFNRGRMESDPTSSTQPRQFLETFYPRDIRELRRSLVSSIASTELMMNYILRNSSDDTTKCECASKIVAMTKNVMKNELRKRLTSRQTFKRIAKQSKDIRGRFIFESISNILISGNSKGLLEFEISWARKLCRGFLYPKLLQYSASFTKPWTCSETCPTVLVSGSWHLPNSKEAMAGLLDGYEDDIFDDRIDVESLANYFYYTNEHNNTAPQILLCVKKTEGDVRHPHMHYCKIP